MHCAYRLKTIFKKGAFRYGGYSLLLMVSLSACKKFIQVDLPPSLLQSDAVYEDSSTAVAAINGVYQQMRDGGILNGIVNNQMNFYADELVSYSNNPSSRELFYNNAVLPTSGELSTFWNITYSQLYAANSVIEGVNRSSGLSPTLKDQLLGESLVIRAILHFYLVNMFGDIPYADTTDYLINSKRFRVNQVEVFARILGDLQTAESLLSAAYPSEEKARINKWVARALMARVYLYVKNWEQAAAMATSVIEQTALYQLEDLDGAFLKESTESIWHFKSIEHSNADEGVIGVLVSPPVPNGFSFSEHFLAAFEAGDQRREHWVGAITTGSETWYFPYKYKEKFSTPATVEYSVVLRLAEQYLIRAEALSQLNQPGAAVSDLNVIRHRAGLPALEVGTPAEMLAAVYQERQVELFYEFSHRWYDLKRTGMANAVLGAVKPGWNATDSLLPVPEPELLVNPNLLPQNPGYQ